MDYPILLQYQAHFPSCVELISSMQNLFHRKLWHELSQAILLFIYHKKVIGNINFDFYQKFVANFHQHINPITKYKIFKECIANLKNDEAIEQIQIALKTESVEEQRYWILRCLQGCYEVKSSKDDEATHNFQETRKYMEKLKSPDAFLSSMFHRFAMYVFMTKGKFKLYYEHALSFMNYTLPSEIQQKEQMEILENMGITTLCSPEIYNFSQLLEQPLLMSLKESPQKWLYDLLEIFMRGDVKTYDEVINSATTYHPQVKKHKKKLHMKIRIMAFVEFCFNLPKGNRVVSFQTVEKCCGVPKNNVEFLVMKAMALDLVRSQIDQVSETITVNWVVPKVLSQEHYATLYEKLMEWQGKVEQTYNYVLNPKNQ